MAFRSHTCGERVDIGGLALRYAAGATIEELVAESGIPRASLHRMLVRAGVQMRRPGPGPKPDALRRNREWRTAQQRAWRQRAVAA